MKTLAELILAGTIFGVVYAAAATLGTGTSVLSAGNTSVASCESGSVTGSPHLTSGSLVDGVTVSGLDPQCAGKTIDVTLTAANGTTSLLNVTGVVPQGGGDVSLTSHAPVDAASVSGVSVAIQG